jgi:hypothetical protein
MLAIDDLEGKTELRLQLVVPLESHGRRDAPPSISSN